MMQSKMVLVLACASLASAELLEWSYSEADCEATVYFHTDKDDGTVDEVSSSNCFPEMDFDPDTGICGATNKCYIERCLKEKNLPTPKLPMQSCPVREHGAKNAAGGTGTGLGGAGLAPSPATSSIRSTRITDPMRGFKDIPLSRFLKFPPTMIGRDALVPSVRTKAGYDVSLECVAPYGGVEGFCDHFVMLYSCPPCEYADGGNLPAVLLADGWVPHRCGAVMDLDNTVPSHLHSLVIYHKQTKEGHWSDPGVDSIIPTELLEFAFYANTPATSYCPAITDEMDCKNHIPAECAWQNGECVAHLCPKPFLAHGPWNANNKCSICPFSDSEKDFIPELKI